MGRGEIYFSVPTILRNENSQSFAAQLLERLLRVHRFGTPENLLTMYVPM